MTVPPETWQVGPARIARIVETGFDVPLVTLLPTLPQDAAASGTATLSVHAWLVTWPDEAGTRQVLVDAGIGNHKTRPSPAFDRLDTPWLARLEAAGATPSTITDVLITHLHPDHVGWLTSRVDGQWVSSFPGARIFLPRAGYEFFRSEIGQAHRNAGLLADSIEPVVATGQAVFVDASGRPDGGNLPPGFTYLPSPGHSVDHFSVRLDVADATVLFAGDVMHQPVQVAHPDHSSMFCADPLQVTASRHAMLALAERSDALVCSSHFPGPSAGRVVAEGATYRWRDEPASPGPG